MQRLILEIGTGNDLYGGNYTKAACRAVQDAIHHSSLILFRSLDISHEKMQVNVTVGVQAPEQVDTNSVAETLPYGKISVSAVSGGLDVPQDDGSDTAVIATAAIVVRFNLPA